MLGSFLTELTRTRDDLLKNAGGTNFSGVNKGWLSRASLFYWSLDHSPNNNCSLSSTPAKTSSETEPSRRASLSLETARMSSHLT